MVTKNWPKFPVLFSLYIAQSIPMSFFSTVMPVIMRQEHYSLESIGLLQLIKLPWIVKFFWAPLVDNHARSGRLIRRWIISSELFYAAVIVAVGFFDLQTDFRLIIFLIVIAFIASATQDIATDIFAIHVLKSHEKGLGNSMQSSGSFVGSLMGTGVLLFAFYYMGWQNLLFLLAAFVLFAIIPLMVYRPKLKIDEEERKRINVFDIFRFFYNKVSLKRLLVLLFYYSGIIGILAMMKPYMVDLGYNVKEIGFMSGIVGTSVASVCALVAGLIIKRLGRKVSIFLFAVLNILAAGYFFLISMNTPTVVELYLAICFIWGAYGLSTVIIYTTSMDVVRKNSEGTDFTVQIVVTHLSSMLVAIFSGRLGDSIGYNGLFGVEVLMGLASLVVLFYNYPVKLKLWK